MSDLLNQIKFYDNLFNPDMLMDLYNSANDSWEWGFQSSADPNDNTDYRSVYKFLMLNILDDDDKILTMLEVLQKISGEKFKLDRAYINAQHYGMPGKPHRDSVDPNKFTFLVYLNPEWKYMWGGQTVFLDEYQDIETKKNIRLSGEAVISFPIFNRSVLFPSNIYHYAEAPTKEYLDFRMTLALKLEKLS